MFCLAHVPKNFFARYARGSPSGRSALRPRGWGRIKLIDGSFAVPAAGQAPEPEAQLGEVDLKVDRTLVFQVTIAIVSPTTHPLCHIVDNSNISFNGFYFK